MSRRVEIGGAVYGAWRVLGHASGEAWDCLCRCGTRRDVDGYSLRKALSLSCGCRRAETSSLASTTHGHTKQRRPSREYLAWLNAKSRCENPARGVFCYYGGRGIRMVDPWRTSFQAFLNDMGPCPPGSTLDRIDVDGNYEASNCRWATRVQQMRNKRTNKRLTVAGKTMCVAEWAELSGVPYGTLQRRLSRGWPAEKAVVATLPRVHR